MFNHAWPLAEPLKTHVIPKKNGQKRTVVAPPRDYKRMLRHLVPILQTQLLVQDEHKLLHAFLPGRSPITNAMAHRGYKYTVTLDVENFFDRVDLLNMLLNSLSGLWAKHGIHAYVCRQGMPTAPYLASLYALHSDRRVKAWLKDRYGSARYTRYADDIAVSHNCPISMRRIVEKIAEIYMEAGLVINQSKTRWQTSAAGRRIITGVAVDDHVHCPRQLKRRLRAATHNGANAHQRGLHEFSLLKEPKADYLRLASRLQASRRYFLQRHLENLGKTFLMTNIEMAEVSYEYVMGLAQSGEPCG